MRAFRTKKIATKILVFGVLMIIVSVTLVSGLIMMDSANYNEKISNIRVESALGDLQDNINDMLTQSEKSATAIAQNYLVIDAVNSTDFEALKSALDDLNSTLNMDTISITDTNGNVIIRQHKPEKFGDSILDQTNVQKALKGETSTTLEPGALVKLSTRSGMPIYNQKGQIIGAVVTGYTFENTSLLDKLKAVHNTDFTIYAGSDAIATTIMQNGEKLIGDKLNDAITKTVIVDGATYSSNVDILGTAYHAKYEPLFDTNGKIVGAIFAGQSNVVANTAIVNMILHILILLPIIIVISSIIMVVFINKTIKEPMHKLTKASDMMARGDLNIAIDQKMKQQKDEIGDLSNAFGLLAESTRKQVDAIKLIAQGDLTIQVDKRSEQDVLGESLCMLVNQLNELASTIAATSDQVANGSGLVSSSAQVLSQGATEQASAVQQLSATIEQIHAQTNRNTKNAEKANEVALTAKTNALDGNRQMSDMLEAMAAIDDSSTKINKIIKVIDDIAFQTNILALNAAVEAARAGQHGKGFSVVAEEVRTLASKSASAAKETTALIENSIIKVRAGTKIANDTANALKQIVTEVEAAADLIGTIVEASYDQAHGIEQINLGISQVSQVAQTNAATAEESAAASEELSAQSEQLNKAVGVFKTTANSTEYLIGVGSYLSENKANSKQFIDLTSNQEYGKY